jgi:hypothetical protein
MKKTTITIVAFIILYLFSCKKSKDETAPAASNNNQNTNAVIKQIRVNAIFDTTPGKLFVYWNKGSGYVVDTFPQNASITTINVERSGSYLAGDSAGIKWLTTPCPTCTTIAAKITVTVSNNVTYTYNAASSNFIYYKFQ